MWKHVIAPTLVVISLWVIFSGMTTWYIFWQDALQSQLLAENVASLRATGRMQEYVWQMQAIAFYDRQSPESRRDRLSNLESSFETALADASRTAVVPGETELIDQIRKKFQTFSRTLQDAIAAGPRGAPEKLRETVDSADAVVAMTQKLLEINKDYLASADRSRETLSAVVFFGRMSVLVLGPALGIWLGLRMSRQLHRSISEISITLEDAAGQLDREIGRVNLSTNLDLPDLRRQVRAVALRIRQIIDELHQAREEVLRQERLAAVGELAAGVAHELRNPMTSVKLLLQSAGQRSRGTPDERQFQIILDEFARMEGTIQGLLDFARPSQLRRVPHDLRLTVHRALNLVEGRARKQGVEVQTDLCDSPLEVDGDPEQLHQVFINLLLNALDAMAEGGTLSVVAQPTPDGRLVRVSLADSGPGIVPEVQQRLFEPFVTSKERGVGLGLAISRRIVHDHEGRIWAENLPGSGAVFTLDLPLRNAAPAEEVRSPFDSVESLAATIGT